jgi:predicted nucleic acid-binding Zn ribbon protein
VTPTALIPAASTTDQRVCLACGAAVTGLRWDARVCSGACRAALSRLQREEPSARFWTAYALIKRPRGAHRRTQGHSTYGGTGR